VTKLLTVGAVALLAFSAAACGRMADLEAPPAKKTERAMRGGGAAALPDPATVNRPPSQLPIDGVGSNPYGGSGSAGRIQG